ncbi:MAG: hypothetical protein DRG63_07390 [Deltaproteobacteria bacterium]|nr:MAG: hypothetical protein DRG63_07390 [Deltaproteobacteria bacterium]
MGKSQMVERVTKPNPIWKTFSSVKLAIVLLILIAITSVLGTFIPQREEAFDFARKLSPTTFHFFQALHLFDMYHATWFRVLIGLLALNLVVCSIDRFPTTWRRFSAQPRPDRTKLFQDLSPEQSFEAKVSGDWLLKAIEAYLNAHYKRVHKALSSGQAFFYGEKGRFSHFGVYLVHLSILVIILGALIGSFFGFEAYVNIMEGDQVHTALLRGRALPIDLGFSVRCNDFRVAFYDNGAPKEYRSDLSFLVNGKVVKSAILLVNHPVRFRGITFYQSSYGSVAGDTAKIRLVKKASKLEATSMTVKVGQKNTLPHQEGTFEITQIKENFMRMGPAVLVSVDSRDGNRYRFWVFQHRETIMQRFPGIFQQFPKLNPSSFEPYTFFLDEIESRYYTGLQLSKDPGVSVVWAGCFLMIGGLFVTFFTSHRRIWIRVSEQKGVAKISVAGMANKNPVGLERELYGLTKALQEKLKGEAQ